MTDPNENGHSPRGVATAGNRWLAGMFAWLEKVEKGLLLGLFWTLALVVFAQFFSRYVIGRPLGWTEEVARYLLIGLCFLGVSVVTRNNEHIAVELIQGVLPPSWRAALALCTELLILALIVLLVWQAWQLSNLGAQQMSSVPLPKSIIYKVVLVGLILHAINNCVRIVGMICDLFCNGEA